MRVLGIDEAGRGCVLGPLVVAGFLTEDMEEARLRDAGAGDSKAMSAKKRVLAREALGALGTPDVHQIDARQIDAGNLNSLEEKAIVALVRTHRPDLVRMDALGPPSGIPKLEARLRTLVGPEYSCDWVIAPKADATYAEVGAASIFAKTTRDETLEALKETWGILGSGYPSDPKTRAWLTRWHASGEPWPPFVRTRWGTIRDLAQQSLL